MNRFIAIFFNNSYVQYPFIQNKDLLVKVFVRFYYKILFFIQEALGII